MSAITQFFRRLAITHNFSSQILRRNLCPISCRSRDIKRYDYLFAPWKYWRKCIKNPFANFTVFSLGILGFFEKDNELSPEDELLLEIKRGVLAMQRDQIDKAERHLANSWKMSVELNREDVQTQIMDIQANLAMKSGQLDRAIRLFQLVAQRLVFHQGYEATDNAIVEISIKLAEIYASRKQFDEAKSGFSYCANTQVQKIEKENIDDENTLMLAAWALQNLSQLILAAETKGEVISRSALHDAKKASEAAYKYACKAGGPECSQAIAIGSDTASIMGMLGEVDEGLKKLEEFDKIASEKFKNLQAAIRVNSGSLYLQKGEYSEAQRICKEARMLAKSIQDDETIFRAEECLARCNAMKKAVKGTQKKST